MDGKVETTVVLSAGSPVDTGVVGLDFDDPCNVRSDINCEVYFELLDNAELDAENDKFVQVLFGYRAIFCILNFNLRFDYGIYFIT